MLILIARSREDKLVDTGKKTTVVARKLRRSVGATYQKARALGVTLGEEAEKRKGSAHVN
jgi:hypothetical protein